MRLLYGINYRCLSAPALPSPAFALHLKLTIFVLHIDLIYLCQSLANVTFIVHDLLHIVKKIIQNLFN